MGICMKDSKSRLSRTGGQIKAKHLKIEFGVIEFWSFFQKIIKTFKDGPINVPVTPEVLESRPIALMLVSKVISQIHG